jgi:hypothetical protein
MASTYELSTSRKIFADIFARTNDHFERDEFKESKRLSTTTPEAKHLPPTPSAKQTLRGGESHQVDYGFIFVCEEQQRFHSRGGNAEIRTHDLRKIHLAVGDGGNANR